MESLVREAFINIEVIRLHVYEGHYDLVTDGEVILPSVWEHVVAPGMSVNMLMWPLPEKSEPDDEETRAAKAAEEAASAAAPVPVRSRFDANDPRWVPPPIVAPDGVFGFPDSPGIDSGTHSLSLALFDLRFDDNIHSARVTVSCNLSSTTEGGAGDANAEWKVAFFRLSSAGVVDDILDDPGFDRTGAQETRLEVKDSESHGVAILLRYRRTDQDVPFPIHFDITYLHHGYYQSGHQVTQNILPGRSESIPWTPLSWAAANGWEDCVEVLLQERGIPPLDCNGRSALSWASGGGQAIVTKLLLDEPSIQVDEADMEGRTPLSWAAGNG